MINIVEADGSSALRDLQDSQAGPLRLVLSGVIDINCVRDLHRRLSDAAISAAGVALDCRAVERLDGSALQVILALKEEVLRQGRTLEIAGASGSLYRYFATAGVASHLVPETASSRT